MTKQFKKGDRVWVYNIMSDLTLSVEEWKLWTEFHGGWLVMKPHKTGTAINGFIFHTKQECIDHIINSIKVIPYEDTTSV